jgi:hypothetical protein
MAKNKVSEWSSNPVNNTDVGNIDIAEGCAPSGINNAIREMMAQIKDFASGADGDSQVIGGNLSVTGTTTLTGAVVASSGITGNLTGNTTGTHIGNVTGNVSGTASNVTGIVAIANGGTNANNAASARTNLGLGSIATQNSNSVNITGGTITGVAGVGEGIGVGQTYQDVSASRALGTTYTNSTGKPIVVNMRVSTTGGGNVITMTVTVNGIVIQALVHQFASSTNNVDNVNFIVPNGQTYSVAATSNGGGIASKTWIELR